MPKIATQAAMYSYNKSNGQTFPAPTGDFVLSLPLTGSPTTQITMSDLSAYGYNTNTKRYDFDSSGNLYVISWVQGTGTAGLIYRTLRINKFLSNGAPSISYQIVLPTVTHYLKQGYVLCDGTDVYIAISYENTLQTTTWTTVMKLTSSLNIVWQNSFTASAKGDVVWLLKHPTLNYLYFAKTSRLLSVYNSTSGALVTTYDAINWQLTVDTYLSSSYNPIYFDYTNNRIVAGCGGTFINLNAGTYTVASVTARTITTANNHGSDMVLSTNGYSYYSNYNDTSGYTGIAKINSSGGISLSYRYSFATFTTSHIRSITTDNTYIYAYVVDNISYYNGLILRFDMDLNYVSGVKVVTGTVFFSDNPKVVGNKIISLYVDTLWCLPNNSTIPGTGTYSINGSTITITPYTGTVTRNTNTLTIASTTPAVTTFTPTNLVQTLTVSPITNPFTYTGI